jgi:hypothetical protein
MKMDTSQYLKNNFDIVFLKDEEGIYLQRMVHSRHEKI